MLPNPDLENVALGALEIVSTHEPRHSSSGTVDGVNDERLYNPDIAVRNIHTMNTTTSSAPRDYLILDSEHPQNDPPTYRLVSSTYLVYDDQSSTTAATIGHGRDHPQYVSQSFPATENRHPDGDNHISEDSPPCVLPESPDQEGGFRETAAPTFLQLTEQYPVTMTAYEESADLVPTQEAWSSYRLSPPAIETHVLYKPRPQVDPECLRYFRGLQQGSIGDDIELKPLILNSPPGSGPKFPPMEPPARTGKYWMEDRWFVENPITFDTTLELRDKEDEKKD